MRRENDHAIPAKYLGNRNIFQTVFLFEETFSECYLLMHERKGVMNEGKQETSINLHGPFMQ